MNKQKLSNNELISIEPVRVSLAELFQSRRKFLLEHPDDPVDALFAILNCFHSNYIVCII